MKKRKVTLGRVILKRLIALMVMSPAVVVATKIATENGAASRRSSSLTIMTFNVENLFDVQDDPKKTDETFLPASKKTSRKHKENCAKIKVKKWREQCLNWDWNEVVLKTKLQRIGRVIREAQVGGAELILFQEVETLSVLERLRREYLSDLGYQVPILIEGKDLRGIDVAMMSKYSLSGKAVLHSIPFKNISKKRRDDTRGILEATFKLPNGTSLTAFSVHFPAPFHPARLRGQAFEFLNRKLKQVPKSHVVVAAGDFNIPSREDKELGVLKKYATPFWRVSHLEGCKGCKGTNYYPPKKSWSFLDMILVAKTHSQVWKLDKKSVRVYNGSKEQMTSKGEPKDFRLPEAKGVSDHWPVLLKLRLQK